MSTDDLKTAVDLVLEKYGGRNLVVEDVNKRIETIVKNIPISKLVFIVVCILKIGNINI